ncbi:MAG: flagellar biosynthesis protein FlhA [Paracoccaceae bacterium]|nr:flagellar biosynthesis protein FlhA [Paracoccaceae bacterium]
MSEVSSPVAARLFQPTILLAMALMAVIVMMILPMPSWVLDIGLAVSFALAILIFTVTLFIERPLDFSAFPTILLASLMLRLSLNVSSTKLIIGQGHTGPAAAGRVIEGFANFVMGGSVLIGLVVFGVLMIVNFIVITKGAARMAEVGARFALDGMPGKQLAIDSDMSAGAITHEEAKRRRQIEQAETTFFGSLDGASKFVKGDAVAGLLITLLNLVVGLTIGVGVHGMALQKAIENYAILTVGDGLVSQIPAVIISIASALLLSRGGTTGAADKALFEQLGRHPSALITVAVLLFMFALVPGLPFVPFMAGALALGGAGVYLARRRKEQAQSAPPEPVVETTPAETLGDRLDVDEIHVEFAPDLVPIAMDQGNGLDARIDNMREHIAATYGLLLPEIRLTDNPTLPEGTYTIRIQGVEEARDRLETGKVLVLLGETQPGEGDIVREPVYGAPARWVPADQREEASIQGLTVVSPAEVLATHLLETLKRNFSKLLNYRSLRLMLDEFANLSDPKKAEMNQRMLDSLIPEKVPFELLLAVLRLLLEEQVSIRNLPLVLETTAEARARLNTAEEIAEYVRQRLGFQIVAEYRRQDGTIPLIQLSPEWEEKFREHAVAGEGILEEIALPPEEFNRLAEAVNDKLNTASETGDYPVIVTSSRRRRFLRMVLSSKGIRNPVLSYEEIGVSARPALVGVA